MKCSIKQQQTTIGYNIIPHAIVEAGTAAVPFGTTLLPSSTTTTTMTLGRRLSKWMLAIVCGDYDATTRGFGGWWHDLAAAGWRNVRGEGPCRCHGWDCGTMLSGYL